MGGARASDNGLRASKNINIVADIACTVAARAADSNCGVAVDTGAVAVADIVVVDIDIFEVPGVTAPVDFDAAGLETVVSILSSPLSFFFSGSIIRQQ